MKVLSVICDVIGILCMIYGLFVMSLGSGTSFHLIWFLTGILIILYGFLMAHHTPVWLKVLMNIIAIAGIAIVIFTQALVIQGFTAEEEQNLDYIIVLGAQVREDGPSAVTLYRLQAALDYLNNNPDTIAITSGGQGDNEPAPEGDVMKEWLISHGIDEERVISENQSKNTIENVINSSAYLNKETDHVGIVTNNFHVYRGTQLAKHAGYKYVYGISAYSTPFYLPNNMYRESFAIVKDYLAGNLS